jgi:hypothetical protein
LSLNSAAKIFLKLYIDLRRVRGVPVDRVRDRGRRLRGVQATPEAEGAHPAAVPLAARHHAARYKPGLPDILTHYTKTVKNVPNFHNLAYLMA